MSEEKDGNLSQNMLDLIARRVWSDLPIALWICERRLTHIPQQNVISGGSSGLVVLLPDGNVRKCAFPESSVRKMCLRDIEREYKIYCRLPQHGRLLRMFSYSAEDGLVLEYMPRGNLREYLQNETADIATSQRLQWACDAAEALQVLHSNDIIHCDVKPENLLLDSDSRLRLIDFSGSSMDGVQGSAMESERFYLPRPIEEPSTVRTDIFALGSTIYEIMTGQKPYADLSNEEVEKNYTEQIFPSLESIQGGHIIEACWRGDVKSAEEAMVLLKGEIHKIQ